MRQIWITSTWLVLMFGSAYQLTATPMMPSPDVSAQQINDLFIQASEKANPSVVTIASERVVRRSYRHPFFDFWGQEFNPERESRGTILGSGVIIDGAEGYIVTNHHVIDEAEDIMVTLVNNREVPAEVVGTDEASDVAVIKIDAEDLPQAEIGNSDELRIGEWVLAIGSPFSENLDHTVTAGIVSGTGRSQVFNRPNRYEDFIQTDAAINPGNSGGALVNLRGDLVGINTAIATDGFSRSNAGVGFAIPVNLVMRVVEDLIREGRVTRAWLGVYIEDVQESLAKALKIKSLNGAIVNQVVEDSPAERAGVKEGDIIIKVGDNDIRNGSHLRNVISSFRPGERPKLVILRDSKEKVIPVRLRELPAQEELASGGRVEDDSDVDDIGGRTGFAVAELGSREAERYDIQVSKGVVVTRIDARSKAARDGIQPGDVVVQVGDREIKGIRDYRQAMKEYGEGDTVLFRVARGEFFFFRGIEIG
jgi:serine protease Do